MLFTILEINILALLSYLNKNRDFPSRYVSASSSILIGFLFFLENVPETKMFLDLFNKFSILGLTGSSTFSG